MIILSCSSISACATQCYKYCLRVGSWKFMFKGSKTKNTVQL